MNNPVASSEASKKIPSLAEDIAAEKQSPLHVQSNAFSEGAGLAATADGSKKKKTHPVALGLTKYPPPPPTDRQPLLRLPIYESPQDVPNLLFPFRSHSRRIKIRMQESAGSLLVAFLLGAPPMAFGCGARIVQVSSLSTALYEVELTMRAKLHLLAEKSRVKEELAEAKHEMEDVKKELEKEEKMEGVENQTPVVSPKESKDFSSESSHRGDPDLEAQTKAKDSQTTTLLRGKAKAKTKWDKERMEAAMEVVPSSLALAPQTWGGGEKVVTATGDTAMGRKGKAEAEASPAKGTPAESEVEKAEEQKETKEPKAKAKSKAKEKAKAKSVTKQLKKKPSMKEVPKTKEEKAGGKKESLMDKTKAWDQDTGMPSDVFLWSTFQGNEQALEKAISNGSVQEYQQDGEVPKTKEEKAGGKKESLMDKTKAWDQDTGMPSDVFLWSTFQGNEQALEKAISNGSVQEYQQDGVTFCSFRKTKAGIESGTQQELHVKSGQVELDQGQYTALSRAFSSIALTFDDETEEGTEQKAESLGQEKQLKQLEAEGLTKEMTEVLADAKQAHERTHQAAMKLLGKCTNGTDKKKFKETVISIQAWAQKNHNVLTWKELEGDKPLTPTNFKEFMADPAQQTRGLNEAVAQFKALLPTRKAQELAFKATVDFQEANTVPPLDLQNNMHRQLLAFANKFVLLPAPFQPKITFKELALGPEDYNNFKAVKALKVVGNSNPQRSIRFLVPRIFDAGELGSAAAEAVRTICELQKDDPEMPELLLKELHDFLNAGLRRPFRAVLELLESVIPKGNEQVMEWIVFILDEGTEEEQGIALDRLSDSQQVCDINATVNLILNRLFCLMDDSKWFDMSESGEKFLMKGLAAVCKQEPGLAHGTLLEFLKDEDSNKVTRAAKTVAAIGADEGLLQAVLAALEVESTRGTTWAVLEICTSLLEISSDTGPQVFQALLKELPRKQYRDNQAVLKVMNACVPLDGTLEALASYLKHANRIRRDEGVAPLLEAAKITDFYIKTFNSPEAKELKSMVKAALAQGIAESGDKKCAEVLPEIVDFEGEGDEVLNSLVAGLGHPSQKVRSLCEDVFLQVVRPDDPRASKVLIRSIEQEIVTSTRCLQIKLLGDVAPRDQTEVVDLLLRLADENDVCIRSTALAQLWACASCEQCLGPLRAHLMEKDEQVRLACLGSILKLEEDLGALQELCLQSLKDGASSVVLLALTTLDDRCDTL
ncbi:unnamed protein product, partial [Cladocopium goreaui]